MYHCFVQDDKCDTVDNPYSLFYSMYDNFASLKEKKFGLYVKFLACFDVEAFFVELEVLLCLFRIFLVECGFLIVTLFTSSFMVETCVILLLCC